MAFPVISWFGTFPAYGFTIGPEAGSDNICTLNELVFSFSFCLVVDAVVEVVGFPPPVGRGRSVTKHFLYHLFFKLLQEVCQVHVRSVGVAPKEVRARSIVRICS